MVPLAADTMITNATNGTNGKFTNGTIGGIPNVAINVGPTMNLFSTTANSKVVAPT